MVRETELTWEVQRSPRASKVIYLLPLSILVVLTMLIRLSGAVDNSIMSIVYIAQGVGVMVVFFLFQRKVKTTVLDKSTIRLANSTLYFEPDGQQIALSRADIAITRAYVTANMPYGTVFSISEHETSRYWRILSDVELTSEHYNGPQTTDLKYNLYMTPELFKDFVSVISNSTSAPVESSDDSKLEDFSDRQVFDATKPMGVIFVLVLVASIFLIIAGLGLLAFLVAKLAPEYEDTAMMILVVMMPMVSIVMISAVIKKKRAHYQLELSPWEIVLTRQDRPGRISIDVASAMAFPINWVSSGKYGTIRTGPGLEIHHAQNRKTRIATYDAQSMWSHPVKDIESPHFIISSDAWKSLVKIIENQSQKTPLD
jgi:hypothetical protein